MREAAPFHKSYWNITCQPDVGTLLEMSCLHRQNTFFFFFFFCGGEIVRTLRDIYLTNRRGLEKERGDQL